MKGTIDGKRAREYDKKIGHGLDSPFTKFILDNIKGKEQIICDLCCGSGVTIEAIYNKVKQIDGIDASKEMIQICKEKFADHKNININFSSATNTNLKSNYYDIVILRMGLHHIKQKQELFNEIKRILKKDGNLILIDKYNFNSLKYNLREIYKLIFRFNKDYLEHFVWSKDKTFNIIEKNFKILKTESLPIKERKYTQNFMMLLKSK